MMATTNAGMREAFLQTIEKPDTMETLMVSGLPMKHARNMLEHASAGILGTDTASLVFQITQSPEN